MTNSDEAESMDFLLGALKRDVEPTPAAARDRIDSRLADAGWMAAAAGGAAAAVALPRRGFSASHWLAAGVALPVGVMLGAVGHAWLAGPAAVQPAVVASAKVAAEPAPMPVGPAPVSVNELPAEAPAAVASVKPRASSSAVEPRGLERELLLLEQARTKLSEGGAVQTLELLRQHHAAYPSSALEQEREALAVRALWAAGRKTEAKRRAEAFVKRFPSSVLRASVERAVGAIP